MFDKIKQIIKDKYGEAVKLVVSEEEIKEPTYISFDEGVPFITPSKEEIKRSTSPAYKPIGSHRFDAGKTKKSNRKRLSANAKLKRRRANA